MIDYSVLCAATLPSLLFRVLSVWISCRFFDCILQGCSARVFADIVGVFSYTIQACTNTFGKLQTCYTCMLIVKLVITEQITLTLCFLFTFSAIISAIIFLCIATIALTVLHESRMCVTFCSGLCVHCTV